MQEQSQDTQPTDEHTQEEAYIIGTLGDAPQAQAETEAPHHINRNHQFQYASGFGIGALIFGAIIAYSFLENQATVHLYGQRSIASLILSVALIITVPITLISYRILHDELATVSEIEKRSGDGRENWFARAAVSLLSGVFVVAGTLIVLFILETLLANSTFSRTGGVFIVAMVAGMLGFGVAFWASALTADSLLVLTGMSILFGLSLAIINVEDPAWFDNSISYMSHARGSDKIFQFTFILSGMVLLAVMRDVVNDLLLLQMLDQFNSLRFKIFSAAVTVLPLFIIGIGLFPTQISPFSDFMHNFSSHVPVFVYLMLMFGLNWFVPIYSRNFRAISGGLGLASVMVIVGWERAGAV